MLVSSIFLPPTIRFDMAGYRLNPKSYIDSADSDNEMKDAKDLSNLFSIVAYFVTQMYKTPFISLFSFPPLDKQGPAKSTSHALEVSTA